MYSNLVSLTVNAKSEPSVLPNEDLAIIFRECPALEYLRLHLSDSFPRLLPYAFPEDDDRCLAMHHLGSLDLDMQVELTVHILSSVQLFPIV